MKWSTQLAGFAVLIALGTSPSWGVVSGSVTGVVRDSAGMPQIGAEVQLLRPDLSVVTSVYTNSFGRFTIASILPGHYALKAMDTSFLPSLRENVHVRGSRMVVNLTLNTLYEVVQWLPAEPRSNNARRDDWAWTLRSAADRPLLRWLEDGPLVMVSDGSGAPPKLKARLMATGQAGTFGESGERFSATVEDTPSNSRELLARVDFASDSDASMESMLGFRQDLGYAGSVQSVAAIALHPEVDEGNNAGMEEAALHSWETMRLGDTIEAEAGSNAVIGRMGGQSPSTAAAALPFASIEWRVGNSTAVSYRMATMTAPVGPNSGSMSETETAAALPQFSARGDNLALEHGLHQEIGWERHTDSSGMAVLVYTDQVDNPVLQAMAHFAADGSSTATVPSGVLFDRTSGLMRAAGPNFSATGVRASFEHRLPGGSQLRATYASGGAVVMPALPPAKPLSQLLAGAYPRPVQTYAISLSGTLDGTKAHWQASYRWQPDDTVTPVDPYALDALAPYLNLRLRQCIHHCSGGSTGIEALVEVRNLLAEGYHPYLVGDGPVLIFAQDQRSLRGGLAFTF
jgi:hypothetical protein